MPRSRFQLRRPLQSLTWAPSQPLALFHLFPQMPARPLCQPHSQNLLKPGSQRLPFFQSPSQPLLPSHPLPLHKSLCPAQPNSLSPSVPSSLCLPKSLPLPTSHSHTPPLYQPRLRSGLQLPSALLLLLLLSVLGPGAGECRAGKNEAGMGFWQGGVDWRDSGEVGRWQPDGWGRSREK